MKPIEELTMFAYGLLEPHEEAPIRSHVDGCPACAKTVDLLRSERRLIERAAAPQVQDVPPAALRNSVPKRPPSRAGLAAAAVLLAALAWTLFHTPPPAPETPAAAQDPLDRLVAELKSPSPLRREIATLALKSHGAAAVERLQKAQADPALIDACRSITPEMRAIEKKLDTLKLDLKMENVTTEDVLKVLREFTGLNLLVDAAATDRLESSVSVEAKNESVGSILRRILEPKGMKALVTEEQVVFLTGKDKTLSPGLLPIRVPSTRAVSAKDLESLASDSPEARDRAAANLRALGFAAEPALWKTLDAPQAEARARAADLLRSLYSPAATPSRTPLEGKVRTFQMTIDLQNTPLPEILEFMTSKSGIPIILDPVAFPNPELEMISYKVADIVLDGALRLMLQPRQKAYAVVGDVIVVTEEGRILNVPRPPYWREPAEARQMEKLLTDLASEDRTRSEKAARDLVEMGQPALGPLALAAAGLEGPAAERCRNARRQVVEELRAWIPDEPSGADLQSLTTAQRDLLSRRVTVAKGTRLEDAMKTLGVKTVLRQGIDLKIVIGLKDVPLGSMLRALLRPGRLDFQMEGETIVVDRAK